MLHWEEKWLLVRSQLSSSTSKAARVDSFASAPPVVRSCEENSHLYSLWLCQREEQILNPSPKRSMSVVFVGFPEDPVLLPIYLTSHSASSPTWFPPLNSRYPHKNLSITFLNVRESIGKEPAVLLGELKTTIKTDIDQSPRLLFTWQKMGRMH